MAILKITRDWGPNPSIVRIVTTDSVATITTAGYLTAQATNISNANFGEFQWRDTDYVLIAHSGGVGFFTVDLVNMSFDTTGIIASQVELTSAQIKTMYTTPVQVIAAPGVGKKIIVGQNVYTYLFDTAQYTGGGAIGLQWGNTANLAGPAASTTLAAATFNGYAASNTFELTPDNTDTLANIENMGVFISNDTAVFATGSGTLLIDIAYQIVPVV